MVGGGGRRLVFGRPYLAVCDRDFTQPEYAWVPSWLVYVRSHSRYPPTVATVGADVNYPGWNPGYVPPPPPPQHTDNLTITIDARCLLLVSAPSISRLPARLTTPPGPINADWGQRGHERGVRYVEAGEEGGGDWGGERRDEGGGIREGRARDGRMRSGDEGGDEGEDEDERGEGREMTERMREGGLGRDEGEDEGGDEDERGEEREVTEEMREGVRER
ncbi:hypothetical protein Bbelb_037520 [Branchiostoma belcheri]|nr:hypothetical protein Bbelb_037520 [Branchiostoma belcheri]